MTRDYDFIGFTYGGKHSIDDFGIYRTSDGSRYNDNLIPQLTDKTADIPGGDGQYYFNSHYKTRTFSISIAFDNLSEEQYAEMRRWLNGKEIKELIFDEAPYKVYSAKIIGTPSIKFICFEQSGQRVYKGEGSIQFTCYYPFAHTPEKTKNGEDGRSAQNYLPNDYPTKGQWLHTSGLSTKHRDGLNPGDIEAPFKFIMSKELQVKIGDSLRLGELVITIMENAQSVVWDSRSGLVTGDVNGVHRPIRFEGKSYGGIPVGGIDPIKVPKSISYATKGEDNQIITYCSNRYKYVGDTLVTAYQDPPFSIEYNYWYY